MDKRPSLASFGNAASAHTRTIPVGIRTISDIIKEYQIGRPAVMKIDIEGYEPALFAGLAATHARALKHIFFEFSVEHMAKCGFDHRSILQ